MKLTNWAGPVRIRQPGSATAAARDMTLRGGRGRNHDQITKSSERSEGRPCRRRTRWHWACLNGRCPALAQGETLVPFTDLPETSTPTRPPTGAARHPHDRRAVHAEGSVLHHAALRPSGDRSGDLPPEGHRAWWTSRCRCRSTSSSKMRSAGAGRRIRVLGQPPPAAGPVEQRPLDRRPAARRARSGRRESRRRASSSSSAPITARKKSSSATQKYKVEQQFGRSLPREKALSPEPLLAYALNGEPLTRHQGSPLRLLVPGWYGVANVKWLRDIHVQEDQYLGKYQARWYRTLRGETIDGEMKWKETASRHMQLKSFIARVTRGRQPAQGAGRRAERRHADQSVEVKVDDGPWQPATMDPATQRQVLLEAVQLHVEWRHAGRAHARLAGHRRDRQRAADRRGAGEQEDVPRGQLATPAQGDDCVSNGVPAR